MRASTEARTRSSRKASITLACAGACAGLGAGGQAALGLDLDGQDGLITETIASKDRLRTYDNIKKYGAERVTDRDKSYAEPDGIRLGNFMLFSGLAARAEWDDNIFRASKDTIADWKSVLEPQLVLQSQLPRHVFDFSLDGKLVSYLENDDQDYANIKGVARGAIHIDHAHTFSMTGSSAIEHEERGESTAPKAAAEPVEIIHHKASAGITRDVGRLYGTLAATAERWTFDDVEAIDGSRLDQSGRDQDVVAASLRAGWRMSPGYDLVGKLRTYRLVNEAEDKFDQDSVGYEAMAGLAFETNPLLRWRLLGGYGIRDYDADGLENLGTYLLEGQVQWLPTQRLTITGIAKRLISETQSADGIGTPVETVVEARADFELRHDLFAHADAEYRNSDFDTTGRIDDTYRLGVGLDYYFTKNWLFTLGFEHETRTSNEADAEMSRNIVRAGAKLRF